MKRLDPILFLFYLGCIPLNLFILPDCWGYHKLFKPVREAKSGLRVPVFNFIGGLIMEDVIKQIVEAEKKAEERIERAKEKAKEVVLNAREEAKLIEKDILKEADERAGSLIEEARREGEDEAKKIIAQGEGELEELRSRAMSNFEAAISEGIKLVRGR